ncbi:MAG: T9SS type A sorting domain-containing protein [Bacteroidetes bacterium]|nr:T9SS type A sorting domain-containing protein [Bacteroidota bacterium]
MSGNVSAQYNTAIINSTIDANEYGTGNVNAYPSGLAWWYVTWDANYLYISIQNANEAEAGIVSIDLNPIVPVNGGTNANGNLNGLPGYDNLTPNLPFRADAVIYFKNNWRALHRANGTGAWTLISAGNGGLSGTADDYADGSYSSNDNGNGAGSDDRRELRVSWANLTGGGGIPPAFNMNGYLAYTCGGACGGMYAQMPQENPSGSYAPGSTPNLVRYFNVGSTTNGASVPPFSRNSYTYIKGASSAITNFGFINVWDFTMNTLGDTIVRSNTTGGDWFIAGTIVVNAGAVYYGPIAGTNYGNTSMNNILVMRQGRLDMDYTNKPMIVYGNIDLFDYGPTDSCLLEMSSVAGGDIQLYGNFKDSSNVLGFNGKTYRGFGPRQRQVWFRGSVQQQLYSYNNDLTFDYARIENFWGVNLVTGKISQYNTLDLALGHIYLNNNNWVTENAAAFISYTNLNSYFVTNGTGYLVQKDLGPGGKTGNVMFPIGHSNTSFRPAWINASTSDSVKVRVIGAAYTNGTSGPAITTDYVNRTWLIEKSTNASVSLTLQYESTDELPGFNRLFCSMMNQQNGMYTNLGPYGANALGSNPYTVTQTGITVTDTFSIASTTPLPVQWLDFTAKKINKDAILKWSVTNQENCLYYTIERSADGKAFIVIGNVIAQNGIGIINYQYYDFGVFYNSNQTLYYRIKQVDVNGNSSYSAIRSLQDNEFDETPFYFNNVNDNLVIKWNKSELVTLTIYDDRGRALFVTSQKLIEGDNSINITGLSTGIYFIQLNSYAKNVTSRVFILND